MIIGGLFYIPSFIYANYSLSFLTYTIPNWSIKEYLIRFIYKNIYFFGLFSFIYICFIFIIYFNKFLKNNYIKIEIIQITLFIIILHELLFLKIPLENEYLLPILPFFLILIDYIFDKRKIFLYILFFLLLSYNFINFNIIKVDVQNNATSGKIGFYIEKGYLIKDVHNRVERYK